MLHGLHRNVLLGLLFPLNALEAFGVNSTAVFLNWTAPYTLDSNVHEGLDIKFCVHAVSSTSSTTLPSKCEIMETEFTYLLPPNSECDEPLFTVTSVSVAGNVTKSYSFPESHQGMHNDVL